MSLFRENNPLRKHLHNVSSNIVKQGVNSIRRGKEEQLCFINTDCLKDATNKLYVVLSFLFTIMIRHYYFSQLFDLIIFLLLLT